MTKDEIIEKLISTQELHDLILNRQDSDIAAHPVFSENYEVQEYWLTDRGLVSDLVLITGNTEISDSILNKLDALANSSRSIKAVVNRLTNDSRGINWGDMSLRAQISHLTPGVFTEAERDAMLQLAYRHAPVPVAEISNVLNEGII